MVLSLAPSTHKEQNLVACLVRRKQQSLCDTPLQTTAKLHAKFEGPNRSHEVTLGPKFAPKHPSWGFGKA
jgi:hypothetical protein